MSNAEKILATSLNVLHNYFNNSIKLFSDLYLIKFVDTSAKFFLYWEISTCWHKMQVGIAFRLCIYDKRNDGKIKFKSKISLL